MKARIFTGFETIRVLSGLDRYGFIVDNMAEFLSISAPERKYIALL
jgi:hypothetical protein